jgi:shikimate dehydrogenase
MDTPLGKAKFAIIGDPVAHSLSPHMHNAAFAELGINAEYESIRVTPDKLDEFMASASSEYAGFNVTIPHKTAVIEHLDWVEDEAAMAKSVNTVVNKNGALIGFSTDGFGLEKALEEAFALTPKGKRFLIVGAGGAARAAAFHLISIGAKALAVANRTFNKAQKLTEDLEKKFPGVEAIPIPSAETAALAEAAEKADILVQSTSLGLKNDDPSPVPENILRENLPVFDMIYKKTRILMDAERVGAPNANGAGMLLHQAAKAFSIWTGRDAPLAIMRKKMLGAGKSENKTK